MKYALWWRLRLAWPWVKQEVFDTKDDAEKFGRMAKRAGDYRVEPDGERPDHSARGDFTVPRPPKAKKPPRPSAAGGYTIPEVRHPESYR